MDVVCVNGKAGPCVSCRLDDYELAALSKVRELLRAMATLDQVKRRPFNGLAGDALSAVDSLMTLLGAARSFVLEDGSSISGSVIRMGDGRSGVAVQDEELAEEAAAAIDF